MSLSPLYPDLTSDLHVSTAFERPPNFRLASFGPGKARNLSGLSEGALLRIPFTYDRNRASLLAPGRARKLHESSLSFRIIWFNTKILAHSVNSLVRVSRRVVEDHRARRPLVSNNPIAAIRMNTLSPMKEAPERTTLLSNSRAQ